MNTKNAMKAGAVGRALRRPFTKDIYATPRTVTDLSQCYFYHTMDIPGYGCVEGEWDLRDGVREYLGRVNFQGKRVLEVGTASGFLCFYMESQGADVVACDLSEDHLWDVVPFARRNHRQLVLDSRPYIRKINDAYWLCHRAYNSRARKVHCTVYTIPEQIGMVDISTFGCVLLHVRDPFLALQNALTLTRETVIVTEVAPEVSTNPESPGESTGPFMVFLPEFRGCEPKETWWLFSPEVIRRFIGVLGFEETRVEYHFQKYRGCNRLLYSVVGHRTRDIPSAL